MMIPQCRICFDTIAVPSRWKIFKFLKEHDNTTISQLVDFTSLRQPTVTHHVNKLVRAGLVVKKKLGKQVFCRVQNISQTCGRCPLFD